MAIQYHFISGLPRSGSTLLAGILRQNPRFHAAMTSPVASLVGAVLPRMGSTSEFATFFNDHKRRTILRGLFDSYYEPLSEKEVVFDTNRSWTAKIPMLRDLYPECRVICCVRDVGWIIDSIEQMINQNCLQTSKLFKNQAETTQQSRIQMLTKSDGGLIGQAWYSLREAWFGRNADRLIVIDYKKLASEPQATLSQLYGELGETPYQHNFDEVVYDERDYDLGIGLGQLHTVRRKVEYQPRRPDIDEGVFREYERWSFWRTNAPRPGCVVIM